MRCTRLIVLGSVLSRGYRSSLLPRPALERRKTPSLASIANRSLEKTGAIRRSELNWRVAAQNPTFGDRIVGPNSVAEPCVGAAATNSIRPPRVRAGSSRSLRAAAGLPDR
jgi:hypothetical protein